jgi:hypothetical protein
MLAVMSSKGLLFAKAAHCRSLSGSSIILLEKIESVVGHEPRRIAIFPPEANAFLRMKNHAIAVGSVRAELHAEVYIAPSLRGVPRFNTIDVFSGTLTRPAVSLIVSSIPISTHFVIVALAG